MKILLITKRLLLRTIGVSDINDAYISWLNSPDITKYLEIRHVKQTYERIYQYLIKRELMPESPHFGIFDCDGTRHIGTVTLNMFNMYYNTADISFVIGHHDAQHKGYATEAVHAVCEYCFKSMKLYKLTGGHYASNIGSLRVFQKNGFIQEGIRKEQVININGQREDIVLYGLLAKNFVRNTKLLDR